jgi:hypothetical protein
MMDWKKYGEVIAPTQFTQSMPVTSSQVVNGPTPMYMPAPSAPFYSQLKPHQLMNTYISWLVFYALVYLFSMSTYWINQVVNSYIVIGIVNYALNLTTWILLLVFFGRCWKIVQDGYTKTSVGRAIGFLFIPFFNFFWIFKAFHGLADELNQFSERHFGNKPQIISRKAVPAFSLVYCLFYLVNIVYNLFYYVLIYSGGGFDFSTIKVVAIVRGVFSIVFVIVTIITITDYYITARKILVNIKQQEQMNV